MGTYDEGLASVYRGVGLKHLSQFCGHYWPLLTIIAAEVVGRPRKFLRETSPVVLACLCGVVVVPVPFPEEEADEEWMECRGEEGVLLLWLWLL